MFIGFVGLGNMGSAMASRLLHAGHRVRLANRSPHKLEKLVGQGAEAAASVLDLAETEVVISMLADDTAYRSVFLRDGLLQSLRSGTIHVNMATVSVELVREIVPLYEQRGVAYVSAPVIGRPDAAAEGKLHILAAGPPRAVATLQPLFDVLGQKTWHFGEKPEQANVVKIATNFTLACAIEAMSEAAQFAKSHDVPPKALLEMLTGTLFAAPAYKTYSSLIVEERFTPPGFKVTLGFKDVKLALAAGEAANVPLPFASVLRDTFLDAIANGDGDLDWSAIAKVAQRHAGAK